MAETEKTKGLLPASEWTDLDEKFKNLADAQREYAGAGGIGKTALRRHIEKELVPEVMRYYDFFGFATPPRLGVYFRDSDNPIHTEVILEALDRSCIEPNIRLAFDEGDVLKARLFLKKNRLPLALVSLMTAYQTLGHEAYKFNPIVEKQESGLVITPITAGPQALADIVRFEELIRKAKLKPHIRVDSNSDVSPEILERVRELQGLDLLKVMGIKI